MMKNYKIRKTGFSSAQLGHCMICGKYVGQVYHQQKKHRYSGWTGDDVENLFGHYWCLLGSRPEVQKLTEAKIETIKKRIESNEMYGNIPL